MARSKQSLGSKTITIIGAVWGTAMFVLGLASSFSLRSTDASAEMLGLIFGFILVLPISVVAFWKPKAAAVALMIDFILFECTVAAHGGASDAIQTLWRLGLPTFALAFGYLYIARNSRANSSL